MDPKADQADFEPVGLALAAPPQAPRASGSLSLVPPRNLLDVFTLLSITGDFPPQSNSIFLLIIIGTTY